MGIVLNVTCALLIFILLNHQINCILIDASNDKINIIVSNENIESIVNGHHIPDSIRYHNVVPDAIMIIPTLGGANIEFNKFFLKNYSDPIQTKIVFSSNAAKKFNETYMFTIYAEIDTKLVTLDIVMISQDVIMWTRAIAHCSILPIENKPSDFNNSVDFNYDRINNTNIEHSKPVSIIVSYLEEPIEAFPESSFSIRPIEYNEIYSQFKFLNQVKIRDTTVHKDIFQFPI